jgi:hypothetical protein
MALGAQRAGKAGKIAVDSGNHHQEQKVAAAVSGGTLSNTRTTIAGENCRILFGGFVTSLGSPSPPPSSPSTLLRFAITPMNRGKFLTRLAGWLAFGAYAFAAATMLLARGRKKTFFTEKWTNI